VATNTPPAGGRATQAGMDFGAAVGVWFASHLVTATPVGRRFGLGVGAFPVRLQFETGTGLDDIEVGLSDGSVILIQCKTRPTLSTSADSGPSIDDRSARALCRLQCDFHIACRSRENIRRLSCCD
jgi:hypothetical protein